MYLAVVAGLQCLFLMFAPVSSLSNSPLGSPVNGHGVWPLQPRPEVVRGFDPPGSPWGAGHRGVDLAGRVGQSVLAADAGTISFAGLVAGKPVVVIDHGDLRTTYEPVAASVSVGDRVGRGEPVGSLELGQSHCFPQACLHWGLLRGETYLNPLLLVGVGPVRLLPLDGTNPVADPVTVFGLRLWGGPADMPFATALW